MSNVDWREKYRDKIKTADEALRVLQPGDRLFIGSACGTPQKLVQALADCPIEDVEITHLLTLGVAPYAQEKLASRYRANAFFISANVRPAVWEGRADYTPVFLSEIPELFRSGRIPLDVALIHVTPPDEHGFCSFGVSVDITKPAADAARHVIAEVNPQMPRTLGDAFIHISKIDAVVENDAPIYEFVTPGESEVARRIAKNVADLVENGSTIQVGYGGIPNALLSYLKDKKDLGVHTEVFSDSTIDLIEAGVINCRRKTLHPRQGRCLLRDGQPAPVRLHQQQPDVRVSPGRLHQRPVRHLPERQDGIHQLGPRGRPDRPGLRRLHRLSVLLRHRRPGGLRPRRGPVQGRQGHHRPPFHPRRRQILAHRSDPDRRRRNCDIAR